MKQLSYPTLYSKAVNGKLIYWQLRIVINDSNTIIYKDHGYIGGTSIIHTETRPLTLSNIDKVSTIGIKLITDKKNKGYRSLADLKISATSNYISELDKQLTVDKFDINDVAKPMKAQPFKVGAMTYPCLGQPKINGARANIRSTKISMGLFGTETKVNISTKEGHEYPVEHIIKAMSLIYKDADLDETVVFDGELYVHGYKSPAIVGASKNPKNPLHPRLEFRVFDLAIPVLDQSERIAYLKEICDKYNRYSCINMVDTVVINSDDEAIEYASDMIAKGYEGAILRDMYAPYYFGGRRKNMLKIKKFEVSEFLVLDVIPWEKDLSKGLFVLKNDTNMESFECTPIGTDDERKMYLKNKYNYIGKKVKVKFYERTIKGLPFHANVILD